MANAVRVENLSQAEQELAPGTGFIPVGGHVDFPIATYKDKHERYARARLEADPPLLKATEVDADVDKQTRTEALQAEGEQQAAAARQAELGRKVEETVLKSAPSASTADDSTRSAGANDERRRHGR
jgi:hypothetical protein